MMSEVDNQAFCRRQIEYWTAQSRAASYLADFAAFERAEREAENYRAILAIVKKWEKG